MTIPFEKDEEVIFELRKHWLSIASLAVILVFFMLLPLAIYGMIIKSFSLSPTLDIVSLLLFFYSLWVLFLFIFFFLQWTNYYLDIWVITNKRVIDIDQKGLFHRDIASVRISDVQDLKIEVKGIIPTLLKLGDIYIQTAGEVREFSLDGAHNPEKAKYVIHSILEKIDNEPDRVVVHKEDIEM